MNKVLAHSILLLGDVFCIWCLWAGYNRFLAIQMQITNSADLIHFSNRVGFFVAGIFLPPIHLLAMVEYFCPSLIIKHKHFLNQSSILALIVLILFGFTGSSWLKSHVEDAGYVYCREVSGAGALARSFVYTKNMDICSEMASENLNHSR